MEMFNHLQNAGELHPYFDYAHGFGVPLASYFVNDGASDPNPTFEIKTADGQLTVAINKEQFDLEGDDGGSLLYYHLENTKGYLDKYYVIAVHEYNVLRFHSRDFDKGITLRIHYKGYTSTYTF